MKSRRSYPLAESGQLPAVRTLGHGLGLRREFFSELAQGPIGDVDFFEVVSENFFTSAARPWGVLERVRSEVPVVVHGVGLGLGDAELPQSDYLANLERLIERVQPAWVSDHLCWTSLQGHHSHDLLPLPRTSAMAAHVADNIARVQDRLRRQLLIENVSSYVEFRNNEMSEVEFLCLVAERADCHVLLDVNNVIVNAHNHGFDPLDFIARVPAHRVRQIHLAGHSLDGSPEEPQLLIDTHVGPVPEVVWQLYGAALARVGPVATSVEWDEDVPSYSVVRQECARARQLSQDFVRARSEPQLLRRA